MYGLDEGKSNEEEVVGLGASVGKGVEERNGECPAVAPIRSGWYAATKMPCYAWIRGECKLGDKCRFEHDPEGAPKTRGADEKGKGKAGK